MVRRGAQVRVCVRVRVCTCVCIYVYVCKNECVSCVKTFVSTLSERVRWSPESGVTDGVWRPWTRYLPTPLTVDGVKIAEGEKSPDARDLSPPPTDESSTVQGPHPPTQVPRVPEEDFQGFQPQTV